MSESMPVRQLAHATFVWAAEVPRLEAAVPSPPLCLPPALALVRALATDGPHGSALQLRYEAPTAAGAAVPLLVGRARTAEDAAALARLVTLTFPSTHGLRPLADAALGERLVPFELDELSPKHVVEIRRVADVGEDGRPALLPWPTTPTDGDLGALLDRAPAGTMLCLHLERTAASEDLVAQLHATVRDLRDDLDATADPARQRALAAHRVWIRELPNAAVQCRVTLVAAEPVAPGLADLVGLTVAGAVPGEGGLGYETVRPRSRQELDLALQLIDDVRAGAWGGTDDVELDSLRPLFCAVEAAAAFQLPAAVVSSADRPSVGALSFPAVRDRLLRAVSSPASDGFVVIDVSRGDYVAIADELERETGRPVRRIRLDASASGFDPFAVPAGASRHAHAGRVIAAFDLAYRSSERSPASWLVLSRAIYDAYEQTRPGAPDVGHLIAAADAVLTRLALPGSGGEGPRADVLARLSLLAGGPLGGVLQSGAPLDWHRLVSEPTVVELGGLSGPQERLFVAGLLLAGFLSWREATPLTPGARHLFVVGGATRLTDALTGEGHDAVAAIVDGVAALVGSGQSVAVVGPSSVPAVGVLPAPHDWALPTHQSGEAIALGAPGLDLVSYGSLASPGVGS